MSVMSETKQCRSPAAAGHDLVGCSIAPFAYLSLTLPGKWCYRRSEEFSYQTTRQTCTRVRASLRLRTLTLLTGQSCLGPRLLGEGSENMGGLGPRKEETDKGEGPCEWLDAVVYWCHRIVKHMFTFYQPLSKFPRTGLGNGAREQLNTRTEICSPTGVSLLAGLSRDFWRYRVDPPVMNVYIRAFSDNCHIVFILPIVFSDPSCNVHT